MFMEMAAVLAVLRQIWRRVLVGAQYLEAVLELQQGRQTEQMVTATVAVVPETRVIVRLLILLAVVVGALQLNILQA
jgi:hypothetical protein